jgi:segregation and condensation protein B
MNDDDRTNTLAAPAEPSLEGDAQVGSPEPQVERRSSRGRAPELRASALVPEDVPLGDDGLAEGQIPEGEPADGLSSEGENEVAKEISDAELEREVAALLFAAADPLSGARLSGLLGDAPRARIDRALEALRERLAVSGLPYELREVAGGWQLFTSPDLSETVASLARVRRDERVSPAALETLAVIAYRQPVTKAEIEAIRGVQAGPILRALVDRGLVRVAGRSTDPGNALLYGTTRQFLDVFGLASLDDLPRDGELLRD